MIKYFKGLFHHYPNKSYFTKVFIVYSSFSLMTMISLALILINFFNRSLQDEAYKYNKSVLKQIQIFSDTYLVGKVNDLIVENFLDLSQNKNISGFFMEEPVDSNANFMRVSDNIKHYEITNSFIESMWIYRKSDDVLISSREGLVYGLSDNEIRANNTLNINIIKESMSNPNNRYWIGAPENKDFWDSKPIISFVQCIPMFSPIEQRRGSVVINIDQNEFFDFINSVLQESNSDLLILDANGKLISHSNLAKMHKSLDYLENLQNIMKEETGFEIVNIANNPVGVSWSKSTINDWKYVSIVPLQALNRKVIMAKQFAIILVVLFIFLSIIGVSMITKRIYKPINTLIITAQKKFGIVQKESNEITYINNVLSNLSVKVKEMKDVMLKNEGLFEYKVVMDILLGNMKDINEFNCRLDIIGKEFTYNHYAIFLMSINQNFFEKLPIDQKEYVTLKLINLINNQLSRDNICLNIAYPTNCITLIINFEKFETVITSIQKLMKILDDEINLDYNIAISSPDCEFKELSYTYEVLNEFNKYSFIYGYQNLFYQEQIERYESNNGSLNLTMLNKFEMNLRSCNIDMVKEQIISNIEFAKSEEWSYNAIQSMLIQLIGIVCRVSREINKSEDKFDKNKLLKQFNAILYIEDCVDWIFTIIDSYEQSISHRNSSIDLDFIDKIAQYITQHIDEQISLNVIADQFNISPNYLSKIFKEGKGCTFSEYIINQKFEKAAQLLLEEQNMKVSEIAEKLGYLNMPYFSKLFKKRYGFTPLQYRKNNT